MDYFDVFENINTNAIQEEGSLKCAHNATCVDGNVKICTDCGSEIEKIQTYEREWRYYDTDAKSNPTRCVARKGETMVILKDLENMGIGENVISLANSIYVQVTKGNIKRGRSSRKAIIAACLFHAYKQLGAPKSCDMLREIMKDANLDKSDFLHGIKQVALNTPKTSKNTTVTYITPRDIICEMMVLLNSSSAQKETVLQLYDKVKDLSQMFQESRPQSVAAGIVYHYICEHGQSISIKEFSSKVKISQLTVNKIRNEVCRVLQRN